jgi:putative nucleotidyltransferase with HDIG domain
MELAEARALVKDKTDKDITVRHLISVEWVMRALAQRLDEDQGRWALAGLFHDLDQDQTGEDPSRHAYLAAEWLREAGVEEPVVNAVLAHAHEQYRTDLMARAVVHADAVAGLLVAAALVRPERSAGMKVSSVKKKLKEKAFAPGVNREEVYEAEAAFGLPLEEFIAVSIAGLQQVAPDIGLSAVGTSPAAGEVLIRLQVAGYGYARGGAGECEAWSEVPVQSSQFTVWCQRVP